MTFEECERCGHGNESGAERCEQCGARLGGGPWLSALPNASPVTAYAAGEAPAGVLPLDFPVRPFESVGDVLGPTFRLYREHLDTVGKIVLVAVPSQAAFEYFVSRPGTGGAVPCVLAWLASAGINALVTGSLVHAVMTLLRTGVSPPLKESFAWGLRKWWTLLLCSLLTTILVGLGTLLFCVPGIILLIVFSVALPAAAAEDLGPIEALKRSARLTQGNLGLIFVTMIVVWVMIAFVNFLIASSGTPPPGAGAQPLTSLVYATVTQLLYSTATTFSLFTYLSLRVSRGEVDAPAALPPTPPTGQLP